MSVPPLCDSAASGRRPWLVGTCVAVLLLVHMLTAWFAAAGKSVTADEILHLTGGYVYNRYGDFRIQPENGNLPQRWAALPAVLMGAPPPNLRDDNPSWTGGDASMVGYDFFYQTGHDHWPMLMAGRAMITLFSAATGLLVFCWTRRLFGTTAGFFTLGLYALDPGLLAHAALTTSDAAATFFLLASAGAFWRHLQNPGRINGIVSGLTFGLACVSKFSAALLVPVFALLLLWRIAVEPRALRSAWWWRGPLIAAGHVLAAMLVIWASYDFRISTFAPGLASSVQYQIVWQDIMVWLGPLRGPIGLVRDLHLLPDSYVCGFAWVVATGKARACFLAGEYGLTGWVRFFPLAFWWKSTLPLLALTAGGLYWAGRQLLTRARPFTRNLTPVAPLLVFFAVYAAFSLTSHLNIGHRHILPLYPVLYILAGGLFALPAGVRLKRTIAAVLFGAQACTCAVAYPDYLAYFNPLAGGPANGWRLLVDSSLDWGQDLPGLAKWLRTHNPPPAAVPVYLSYFGSGNPDYYGIKAVSLPFLNGFRRPSVWYEPHGGLYAVSATMLQQVYSPVRGPWTPAWEREYQQLRRFAPALQVELARIVPDPRHPYAAPPPAEAAWRRFDQLRFARLCACLRARAPEAMIGYSILIYRLSDEEVDRMLNRRYSDWLTAAQPDAAP